MGGHRSLIDNPHTLTRAERRAIAALAVKKNRAQLGQTYAEGDTLVFEALVSDWVVHRIVATTEWVAEGGLHRLHKPLAQRSIPISVVDTDAFSQLTTLETSQGVLAVVSPPESDHRIPDTGTFLLLDRIADPLNVGAIARSAAFFGIDGLLLTPGTSDSLHPRALRASMGGLFFISTYQVTHDELQQYLKRVKGVLITADANIGDTKFPAFAPAAVVLAVGSEAHGIHPEISSQAQYHWRLQPHGRDLTLNAAQAATLFIDHWFRNADR